MATTTHQQDVLAFAKEFDTPGVRQMVALAKAGRITWAEAAEIARKALAKGLAEVASPSCRRASPQRPGRPRSSGPTSPWADARTSISSSRPTPARKII